MKLFSIALIGSALVMSGAVAAKETHASEPVNASQYYGLYQNPSQAIAPSGSDSADFAHSGTRGREDLGAGTFDPKGPGNVSD
ncbi:MAG: hypothetical protein ACLPSF_07835 [Methylocella sp.]